MTISKVQEVAVGNFIPHPATVIAINLTTIRTDSGSVKNQQQCDDSESIVLNVAGRLLMFQRDRSAPQLKQRDKHKERPVSDSVRYVLV